MFQESLFRFPGLTLYMLEDISIVFHLGEIYFIRTKIYKNMYSCKLPNIILIFGPIMMSMANNLTRLSATDGCNYTTPICNPGRASINNRSFKFSKRLL